MLVFGERVRENRSTQEEISWDKGTEVPTANLTHIMAFHAVKGREEFAKAKQSTSKLRLFLSVCCTCRAVVLLNKPMAILTSSLRSPSSMLKLPSVSGALRDPTRQNRLQGRQLKLGQKSKRKTDPCYLFIYLFISLLISFFQKFEIAEHI